MKRRTYFTMLGSIAAGGAATMSTSAAVDIWRTQDAGVSVVSDSDGLIGFEKGEENGQFASTDGGSLSVDISTSDADGLNVDTRTTIDDIFRVRNQSNDPQVIWIKDTLDDQSDLFGDEGPLHFFRGPVKTTNDSGNGVLGELRRIFSQLDPVPGTPGSKQRLTIVGLVPPKANIGSDPPDKARKAWINQGHPVTKLNVANFTDEERREVGPAIDLSGVSNDTSVVVGKSKGRFFFEPGEEMKVGLAADFSGFDGTDDEITLGQNVLDEIEIVSRSLEDARDLATGGTEFNPI